MQFFSAGESHGAALVAVLSGFPAGLKFDEVLFNDELKRRKSGLAQSPRLDHESDHVQVLSGLYGGFTTGAPISFLVENEGMQFFENRVKGKGFPRPGHVDYSSYAKYGYDAFWLGAERSSARETVLRVAAGSLCKMMLREFDMCINSEIIEIGGCEYADFDSLKHRSYPEKGSCGGVLRIFLNGVPVGLGSNSQWSDKLDGRLAGAFVSIPSVKGVFFGNTSIHRMRGVESLDHFEGKEGKRKSNHAGGIEGGISNGCPIVATLYFKPVPTQPCEFETLDPIDGTEGKTGGGMNDLWCVDRAAVIAESVMAMVVADAFLEKFGSDFMSDIKTSYENYCLRLK
jgi:chorismate synthase